MTTRAPAVAEEAVGGREGASGLGAAAPRLRAGRPRSHDADLAIEEAALEVLVQEGFAGMTIEGIAARAGVGKATVYRRWAAKEDLVVHAVHRKCMEHFVAPDTGSVRTDLLEILRTLLGRFQRDGALMSAFAAEQGRHPELAEAFRTTFLAERRAVVQEVVARGIARGELAEGTDVELVGDVGPALFWHRLTVTGAPLDDDLPERIVDQFLGPAPSRRD